MSVFYSVNFFFIFIFFVYFILILNDKSVFLSFCNSTFSYLGVINILKKFLILIFLILLIVILLNNKIEKSLRFEFFYILGFSFIGMILLLISNDLIIMFLSLELQTFGLYILIAMQQKRLLVQKQV